MTKPSNGVRIAVGLVVAAMMGCVGRGPAEMEVDIARAQAALERDEVGPAVDLLTDVCEEGAPAACRQVGDLWLSGRATSLIGGDPSGAASPFGRGLKLMQRACELGDGLSCWDVGRKHLGVVGIPRDEAAALGWFTRGCRAGHAVSCVDQGLMTDDGRGVARDPAKALLLYEAACGMGDGRGCTKQGLAIRAGGVGPPDGPRGVALMEEGCRKGFLGGCGLAAIAWEQGLGVTSDAGRRMEMLIAGAALGDERAVTAIFDLQQTGVEGSPLVALDGVLAERCERGEGGVCHARAALAEAISDRDVARVAGLYERACRAGSGAGCGRLAEMAEEGLAAEPDGGLVLLHERACRADRAISCMWLGRAYEAGDLTEEPDLRRAEKAWGTACRLGRVEACGEEGRVAEARAAGPTSDVGASDQPPPSGVQPAFR